jgi:hypothetical protein
MLSVAATSTDSSQRDMFRFDLVDHSAFNASLVSERDPYHMNPTIAIRSNNFPESTPGHSPAGQQGQDSASEVPTIGLSSSLSSCSYFPPIPNRQDGRSSDQSSSSNQLRRTIQFLVERSTVLGLNIPPTGLTQREALGSRDAARAADTRRHVPGSDSESETDSETLSETFAALLREACFDE